MLHTFQQVAFLNKFYCFMPQKQKDLILCLCGTDFIRFAVDLCWGKEKAQQPHQASQMGLFMHSSSCISKFLSRKPYDLWAAGSSVVSLVSTFFQVPRVNWKEQIFMLHPDLTECSWQRDCLEVSFCHLILPLDPVTASSLFQANDREHRIYNPSADFYLMTFWRLLLISRTYWGRRLFSQSLFWVPKSLA